MLAGRRMFAAHGGGVPLESVAEAAGVGIATLYRNFDSRHALASAVALSTLEDMTAAVTAARSAMADDADAAWTAFISHMIELDLGALSHALGSLLPVGLTGPLRAAQDAALADVTAIMGDARRAGLVRAELDPLELVLALGMITRPQPAAVRELTPELIPRLTRILLAGLRA